MGGRLYLYDAGVGDLREREVQLARQLAQGQVLERWEIVATPSRCELLAMLGSDSRASPPRTSVSLIDLKAGDADIGQSGFRVCQTIIRNQELCEVTRPLLWVDRHTKGNLGAAQSCGAVAVIDDGWVDREDGAPLAEVVEWADGQPASPQGSVRAMPRVFPEDSACNLQEAEERRRAFEERFGLAHREEHFPILWGLADSVEIQLLDRYVSEDLKLTSRQVKRSREALQARMREEVGLNDRPESARAEIARRFLSTVVPPHPNPLESLDWPQLDRLADLAFEPDVARASFVPRRLLDQLADLIGKWQARRRESTVALQTEKRRKAKGETDKPPGLSQSEKIAIEREALGRALGELPTEEERSSSALAEDLRFAARALEDTKLDQLRSASRPRGA